MHSPNMERQRQRRERALEVATVHFARYGYAKAEMAEIAAAARMGKRTLYDDFGSKEQLYLEVLEYAVRRAFRQVGEALDGVSDPVHYFQRYIEVLIGYLSDNAWALERLLQPDIASRETLTEIFRKSQDSFHSRHAEMLEAGIHAGRFRPMDSGYAVWMIHTTCLAVVYENSMIHRYERDELIGKTVDMLLASLGA